MWKFSETYAASTSAAAPDKPKRFKGPKFKHARRRADKGKKQPSLDNPGLDASLSSSSATLDSSIVSLHCDFNNVNPVRHCIILNQDPDLMLSGDILGDLQVYDMSRKVHLYEVPDPRYARYDAGMFRQAFFLTLFCELDQ